MVKLNKTEIMEGLLISFFTIMILTAGFELYLRATFDVHTPSGCTIYSDKLLWKGKPNCGDLNNLGFRDYNHKLEKPEQTYRIVVIGDSVVQGHEVELDETFGKQLERKLNNYSNKTKKFEVILMGYSGYTLEQEIFLLEQASEYNPDLIIWNYILNDALNPVYHPINYNQPRYGFQNEWYKPKLHILAYLQKKIFFFKEKIKGKNCPEEYHSFIQCAYQDKVKENIEKIGDFSKSSDVPVLFIINPIYYPGAHNNYGLANLHKELTFLGQEANLIVYDLSELFEYHDVSEIGMCNNYGCDVWHPSAKGHEIIANYLYEKVSGEGRYYRRDRQGRRNGRGNHGKE